MRWADAGGDFRVGPDSTLWGRASATGTMSLGDGTCFERLGAPRIVFGVDPGDSSNPRSPVGTQASMEPPKGAVISDGRWSIDGDLNVPDGTLVPASLVLTGALTLGQAAKVDGAVHATTVVAGDDCVFTHSIVAERRLAAGDRCLIAGPVAVEGEAVFGTGCRIGDRGDETTITAISVRVASGVVLCGEIWARADGRVSPKEPAVG
jgi:hypothetical protein